MKEAEAVKSYKKAKAAYLDYSRMQDRYAGDTTTLEERLWVDYRLSVILITKLGLTDHSNDSPRSA